MNMFSINLTRLTRKALWLLLALLFVLLLIFQLFGASIRRPTGTTGSIACASVVSSKQNSYESYATMSVSAPGVVEAPSGRNLASMVDDEDEDGAVVLMSDIFLYPANIIVANGHKVEITGKMRAEAPKGKEALTTVWVDEDDDNDRDEGELITLKSSVMSSVYLYGGYDTIQTNGNRCNNISITMTGGEIGAIFAGGYYQNVTAKNVDIKILGGSVQYVDCGSQAGPLAESLTADAISVMLKDCRYRSNFPINGINKNSFRCNNVSVIDLADHRNADSYTRHKPIFASYISQIASSRYIFGGHVTIPDSIQIKADIIVVEDSACVNNMGMVQTASCKDAIMLKDAVWTGNEIETTHYEGDVLSYDYKSHTRVCSSCKQKICRNHVWVYPRHDESSHTKQCGVCGYSYTEDCTMKTTYDCSYIQQSKCVYCKNTNTTTDNSKLCTDTACTHPTKSVSTLPTTRHRTELLPDSLVEYDIRVKINCCGECKALLPFYIYDNGYHFFRDLTHASAYIADNNIASATIYMTCDAFEQDGNVSDELYTSGKITLEMNGCDIYNRQLIVRSGDITIKNSQFSGYNYSHIYGDDPITVPGKYKTPLDTDPAAKVTLDGCYVSMLEIYDMFASYKLGHVAFDCLDVDSKSKLTFKTGSDGQAECSVLAIKLLRVNPEIEKTILPFGYVLKECQGNGRWIRRYDINDQLPSYMGPMVSAAGVAKTGSVAIMPCTQHKVTSANAVSDSLHVGHCIYCKGKVIEEHEMSSAEPSDEFMHIKKCRLCGKNKGALGYHDYGADGTCAVSGCGHTAPVSVHGHYSAQKTYFSSFDEAFTAVNSANMFDTITMYEDQTNHLNVTLDKELAVIYRYNKTNLGVVSSSRIWIGPHIHIAGQNHTLYNEGAIKVPSETPYLYSLEMSGDTATYYHHNTDFNIKAAPGYSRMIFYSLKGSEPAKGIISPCGHLSTNAVYVQVTDNNGNLMAYHKDSCTNCGRVKYEDHVFPLQLSKQGQCEKCSVRRTSVVSALVYREGIDEPLKCRTLKAAWDSAVVYSQNNYTIPMAWMPTNKVHKTARIKVLKDVSLYNEGSSSPFCLEIPETCPDASIILDAIDDEGIEHTITGWGDDVNGIYADFVIKIEYGQLTINSGIYQGYHYGVHTSDYKKLILNGGTFKNGKKKNGTICDGLIGHVQTCKNIISCVPEGSALLVKSQGSQKLVLPGKVFLGWRYDGLGLHSVGSGVLAANGTVMPCPHSNYRVSEYVAPTCTDEGMKAHIYCNLCYARVLQESGERVFGLKAITIPALGHEYKGNDPVCTRCGLYKDAITVTGYDKNHNVVIDPEKYSEFETAWYSTYLQYTSMQLGYKEGASVDDFSHFEMTFDADVNMTPGQPLMDHATAPYKMTIDLRGHSLNLNDAVMMGNGTDLTITDSSNSGNSSVEGAFCLDSDVLSLTLDGVKWRTSDFKCQRLIMTNGAGLTFDGGGVDTAHVSLTTVSMENGCWMEGIGHSHFNLVAVDEGYGKEYDLDEAIVDLNHMVEITQQDCTGKWIDAVGTHYFDFTTDVDTARVIKVLNKDLHNIKVPASTCYRWYAEKSDVKHNIVNSGCYCTDCKFDTHHYLLKDDGNNYTNTVSRKYKGVDYARSFGAASVWEPLYIPMSIAPGDYTDVCDIADIYSFGQLYDTNGDGKLDAKDETWLIVDLMKEGVTDPYYPYLIRSKSKGLHLLNSSDNWLKSVPTSHPWYSCSTSHTKYDIIGTSMLTVNISQEDNTFVMNDGKFNVLGYRGDIAPLRWYMRATQNGSGYKNALAQAQANGIRVMVIGEDMSEETALQLLRGETVEVNLDGQRYTLDGRKAVNTQSGIQVLNGKTIMIK